MLLVRSGLNCLRKVMSGNSAIAVRLQRRAVQADDIIGRLKLQLSDLKKSTRTKLTSSNEPCDVTALQAENKQLHLQVEKALTKLIALEKSHGVVQVQLPVKGSTADGTPSLAEVKGHDDGAPWTRNSQALEPGDKEEEQSEISKPECKQPTKSGKKGDKSKKPPDSALPPPLEPDITAVDLRIGRILEVKRHPDADTLYVEQIELGEASPRTVVSGLVNFVSIEEMENRMVIICCNLKPAKMRGVLSQAMVMCAIKDDKLDILVPPEGAVPGDRVSCQGYELGDYPPQMNPKKKIFEKIKPHLGTDANKVAGYKGAAFVVEGKGLCVAPSLSGAVVR